MFSYKLKRIPNDHSTTHTSIYVLQFINYLHQYIQSIEKITPLFVNNFHRNRKSLISFFVF